MAEEMTPLDYVKVSLEMAVSQLTEPYVDAQWARTSIKYAQGWLKKAMDAAPADVPGASTDNPGSAAPKAPA